ncbi:MAG: hypothetical protein ACOYB3_00290 [Azonexus sp.]
MASKAERLVNHILEAGIDPGDYPDWVHPEKHEKIGQRTHPLGRNPAFPNWTPPEGSKSSHWEELLASEQYQATLRRLSDFINRSKPEGQRQPLRRQDIGSVMQAMMSAVGQAMQMERPHANRLVKMAIDLIFEQPEFAKLKEPYQNGEFKIDAKLGPGELGNATLSNDAQEEPEEGGEEQGGEAEEVEREAQAADALADITPEIAKRKVINALIHGGAVSKNYAYQLVQTDLAAINPNLTTLYGIAMAGSELGYFAMPDSMAAMAKDNPDLAGGSSEVEFEEGNVPVVKARGLIFPMLIQELAKGLLELVSYEGLPSDPKMAQEVIDKSDFVDEESWAMIMGRGLWTRFVSALGGDQDEITMHLYNKIVSMPVDQFNQTMQAIQAGGPQAQAIVKRLAQEIRMDMEAQDRAESGFQSSSEDEPPEYPEGKEPWR